MEHGIEKGIEQGIQQGIIKTAINLLDNGMDIEFISKVTGLSVQKIKELTKK